MKSIEQYALSEDCTDEVADLIRLGGLSDRALSFRRVGSQKLGDGGTFVFKQHKRLFTRLDPDDLERARQEVEAYGKLRGYTGVGTLYASLITNKRAVLITAHGGPNLQEVVYRAASAAIADAKGNTVEPYQIPEQVAKHHIYNIAKGLKAMHDLGFVHRDVKPENVTVGKHRNDWRLIDFEEVLNLAKPASKRRARVSYTPMCVCPEYALAVRSECADMREIIWAISSPKIDVWCFGVTLYFALYGIYPFGGHDFDDEDILDRVLTRRLVFPDWPSVSNAGKDLLRQCLSKAAAERPCMEEVLRHEWFSAVHFERRTSAAGASPFARMAAQPWYLPHDTFVQDYWDQAIRQMAEEGVARHGGRVMKVEDAVRKYVRSGRLMADAREAEARLGPEEMPWVVQPSEPSSTAPGACGKECEGEGQSIMFGSAPRRGHGSFVRSLNSVMKEKTGARERLVRAATLVRRSATRQSKRVWKMLSMLRRLLPAARQKPAMSTLEE